MASRIIAGVEFRNIPGFPRYLAGNDGTIWSEKRKLLLRTRFHRRYPTLTIRREDGRWITVNVHVLVALAFHGPKPEGYECRHLNGDRNDNRPENLSWGTHKQNAEDAIRHGTTLRGVRHPRAGAKLTDHAVREIRQCANAGMKNRILAMMFGVSPRTIRTVVQREAWRHVN